MNKMLLLLIMSSSLIFSCSNTSVNQNMNSDYVTISPSASPSVLLIESNQETSDIEVNEGEDFIIVLEGDATTGYQWVIDNYNKDNINFVISKYEPSNIQVNNQLEKDGKYTFTFKALKPGKSDVLMTYLRPWEQGIEPIKTQKFNVNIKAKNTSIFNLKFFNDIKKKMGF